VKAAIEKGIERARSSNVDRKGKAKGILKATGKAIERLL